MDKKENLTKPGTKPVHTVRQGAIAANIWQRQSQTGFPYYEYSLSRSWKSTAKGKEGYSQNFFCESHDALVQVISKTSDWIAKRMLEADTERGNSPVAQRTTEQGAQAAA